MNSDQDLLNSLEEEAAQTPKKEASSDSLAQIQKLGEEVNQLSTQIELLEDELKRAKVRKYEILTKEMVDLMDTVGVDSFSVNGVPYSIVTEYKANIKADAENAAEAFQWLEENDAGDLIKREVKGVFGRDAQEQADNLARYIRERYQDASVEVKLGVPWARLTSWVKERLQEGDPLPMDLLGASAIRIVKINKAK